MHQYNGVSTLNSAFVSNGPAIATDRVLRNRRRRLGEKLGFFLKKVSGILVPPI